MPTLTRSVHSHRQDGDDDCGRACAQMVIGYVMDGVASGAALIQQGPLANTENNKHKNWSTDPDELMFMVNQEVTPFTSVRWTLANYSAAIPTQVVPATEALLQSIRMTIDNENPAIVAKGAADHWSVIYGYDDLPNGGTVLYQWDPLASGEAGTFVHASGDACPQDSDQTISYYPQPEYAPDYFILDADPWLDRAVALVTHRARTDEEILSIQLRIADMERRARRFNRWWWLPPRPTPPPYLPWFVPRDVSLRVVAHQWRLVLRDLVAQLKSFTGAEVIDRMQPSLARIRYVRYDHDQRPPFVLVGVPAGDDAGIIAVYDLAAQLRSFSLTTRRTLVDSLAATDLFDAEDLVCVPRFGPCQPFVRRQTDAGVRSLVRLHDGAVLTAAQKARG
jgi:hypothetical protein